jgi:hypothetical protein
MDIHKPKPWHGWREFLKEYGIIVLGVLTALGAEQFVEALHWRHEVADTREALDRELADDRTRLERMRSQDACYLRRLDDLDRWADAGLPGSPTSLGEPTFRSFHTSAWEVAEASQAAAHIPLAQRLRYGSLFDALTTGRAAVNDEREAWTAILAVAAAPGGAGAPDRMKQATAVARDRAQHRRSNYPILSADFDSLGVRLDPAAARMTVDGTLCGPLLPGRKKR